MIARQATDEVVAAAGKLHEAVDTVIRRVAAGVQRRPGATDEKTVDAVGIADEPFTQQPREGWQTAVRCPALDQHAIAGVHFQKQHARAHGVSTTEALRVAPGPNK